MKYLGKITDNKDLVTKEYVDNADSTKQPTLVSGTNIKTINNQSLLGSGNLVVGGGGLNGISNDSSDNIVIDNDLYVGGHSSYIGTEVETHNTTSKSITANSVANLTSIQLDAGVWVVSGSCTVATSSTATRGSSLCIGVGSGTMNANLYGNNIRSDYWRSVTAGSYIQSVTGFVVSPADGTTYYLNFNSTIATSITATAMRAVRIA